MVYLLEIDGRDDYWPQDKYNENLYLIDSNRDLYTWDGGHSILNPSILVVAVCSYLAVHPSSWTTAGCC